MATQMDQPIAQLLTRYKITKPALYNRMKGLGISTFKVGRKAYVSSENIELLDKLEQHIYDGGTIADFVRTDEGTISSPKPSPQPLSKESPQQLSKPLNEELSETSEPIPDIQSGGLLQALPLLVNSLADAISQRITPPANPLAELEALEKAYEKKWILSTSQLASLLKLNPKTLIRYKSFERHGFTFTKFGQVGTETGWRVGKVDL